MVRAFRIGFPVALVVAGVALMLAGLGEAGLGVGASLVFIAGLVAIWNWFLRLSFASGADREREERARDHFARHGTWPDDAA